MALSSIKIDQGMLFSESLKKMRNANVELTILDDFQKFFFFLIFFFLNIILALVFMNLSCTTRAEKSLV